jgi:hypothetical protein
MYKVPENIEGGERRKYINDVVRLEETIEA